VKYFIKTFGCAANTADSERIASLYQARGYTEAKNYDEADVVVINTCVVRQAAEDRVYGLVKNLALKKQNNSHFKIVVTGCLVGAAQRDNSGRRLKNLQKMLPEVDEFLPIDEVGFDYTPLRRDKKNALVSISAGCNNMCTYCIVPFSRGQEVSRSFESIMSEVKNLATQGYEAITLLGQNVNSYGADFLRQKPMQKFKLPNGREVDPILVKSMGRTRIPTLFPYLLAEVAKLPFQKVSFMSSNPWDFSPELIETIANHTNINRELHLPVQSGDDEILKKMNRWYTQADYLDLIKRIKTRVPQISFTTDIIVGFPSETEAHFANTVELCHQVNFNIAYISCYSPRVGTAAEHLVDDVSVVEKKRRFHVLDDLINKKNYK